MDWSSTQGHILTGGGRLEELYQPPNHPFTLQELPHYHKCKGDTWETFSRWKAHSASDSSCVAGAWKRPLFVGGWSHSDSITENVVNLQTPTYFIDMRQPNLAPATAAGLASAGRLQNLSLSQLRLLARRHAFAGYTKVEEIGGAPVATRHHTIDWNFVGPPRPRPNKWRIEMNPHNDNVWKEWGWARDGHGQHVYMERWERLEGGSGPYLALRRKNDNVSAGGVARDAYLIVCGSHVGFIEDRPTPQPFDLAQKESGQASLVALVDEAVAAGDRAKAEAYLSLRCVHCLITTGKPWIIDWSLHPWEVGTALLCPGDISVCRGGKEVMWGADRWVVVENTIGGEDRLAALFGARARL